MTWRGMAVCCRWSTGRGYVFVCVEEDTCAVGGPLEGYVCVWRRIRVL
jgi:hypothetical protein